MTTRKNTEAQAPTDAQWMKSYDERQAEQAQSLLASLPTRKTRARRTAKTTEH